MTISVSQRLALICALSSVALFACGGDEDPQSDTGTDVGADAADATETGADAAEDLGPTDSVTGTQWCRQSAEVWCDWMYACFDDEDIRRAETGFRFEIEDRCLSTLDADCQARTLLSVSDGRQEFSGGDAYACLESLAAEPCDDFDAMVAGTAFYPDECRTVTTGLVRRGEECTNSPDCASDDSLCWYQGDPPGYCTGQLGRDAFSTECDPAAELNDCEGVLCLGLPENGAGWAGVCSAFCRTDRNCGPDAGCFQLEDAQLCLGVCESDDDCADDLACIPTGDRSACTVPAAE
jgi:hypothetical protein